MSDIWSNLENATHPVGLIPDPRQATDGNYDWVGVVHRRCCYWEDLRHYQDAGCENDNLVVNDYFELRALESNNAHPVSSIVLKAKLFLQYFDDVWELQKLRTTLWHKY